MIEETRSDDITLLATRNDELDKLKDEQVISKKKTTESEWHLWTHFFKYNINGQFPKNPQLPFEPRTSFMDNL